MKKGVIILSLADILINLSSGWFGLVVFINKFPVDIYDVIANIVYGFVALLSAVLLKSL